MARLQKMVLKPKEQLVTRLFLSPKLKQNLAVLSYSTYDLVNVMKDLAESDPFVSLKQPQNSEHSLEWLRTPKGENLVDHLLMQVELNNWRSKEKQAVKLLIYNLDQDGYLRVDLPDLATQTEFLVAELIHARDLLQELDPCGIGASDLAECLLLQAKRQSDFNPIAIELLTNKQLTLLADKQNWPNSSYSQEQLQQALSSIQTLNPLPASQFINDTNTQYLIPDLIYRLNDGRLTIESFQNQIPEILFDERSFSKLKKQSEQKQYFSEQKQRYVELKAAIMHRHQTLMRLGKFVGEQQYAFLTTLEKEQLRPLGLKEAARELNLAPSTISRAIKDKYIQCQNKIFSLKLLFPRAVTADLSQAKIEYDLMQLIKNEDHANPLSDQQLVEQFAAKGINLSRRVITKYRQKLNIANSYHRKTK
ncbi:RNA polymerase factor sigma-54 [Lactobacillus sp. ESL0731]|uniref:RNA polymerase factor sigma-54 n=1 Tax=unclassified Lactobacillus TaxID=2620435 RepID=UPI0023F93DC1|nr:MULTISPECIES: RNA polymerase factor sigma-54 [unclassified Lactobacillus]WEV51366.1 RNA polymerase factor sigma-54 [Lactobacillus sp. ESL0700]WEV62496.1 RNA polymerase factor sigma-54 [Lactobacillus sp. ESL0731]